MASTCYPPSGGFSSLPQHILERIVAAAGTGSCGAALSCHALLSAWRTALATDPRLAASILLSRAAVMDNTDQRAMWIVSQLYNTRPVNQMPAALAALQRPETIPRDVNRKKRMIGGLLSSPQGVLVRALASDQERADYATAFVRELPPQVFGLARDLARETSRAVTVAIHAFAFQHIGVIVELLLRGCLPWATVVAACLTLDARLLGACVAAYRADLRARYDDRSPGLSALGNDSTWRRPSMASQIAEGFNVRTQSAMWLAVLLLWLEFAVYQFASAAVHKVLAIGSSEARTTARGSIAATAATATTTNAACVRLPASVTQSSLRAPLYPAAASLGTAAAAAAFVNYLAACSLDMYDTIRPPCHQQQQTCHTHGEASIRTRLPSSAPNPAALRHHHPALCGDCYIRAREAVQLPQSPAAHAATHGYWPVAHLLLERLVYGVAEPAAVPFGYVRQVYGDAKDLVLIAWRAGRGCYVGRLLLLLVALQAVVSASVVVGLVLAWAVAGVLLLELAAAVLWRCVLWVPVQLMGVLRRGLAQLCWV